MDIKHKPHVQSGFEFFICHKKLVHKKGALCAEQAGIHSMPLLYECLSQRQLRIQARACAAKECYRLCFASPKHYTETPVKTQAQITSRVWAQEHNSAEQG